jgi:5-methylcytosine-specific restriction endonuclease McrA
LLNQSYEPLTVCNVRKALLLLLLGKAELLSQNPKRQIKTVSKNYPWPSVIRLKTYIRVPFQKIILSRKNILRRDHHKCAYCGRSDLPLTIDHIMPRSKGGDDSWENLVSACMPCNNKKGDMLLEEVNMKLRIRPFTPNYIVFIKNASNRIDDSWKPFLFHE